MEKTIFWIIVGLVLILDFLLIVLWRRKNDKKYLQEPNCPQVKFFGQLSPVLTELKLFPEKLESFVQRERKFNTTRSQFGLLIGIFLAIIPVALIFYDRWLGHDEIYDRYHIIWCQFDFLCQSSFPSYFILIFPATLLFSLLFFLLAHPCDWNKPAEVPFANESKASILPFDQRQITYSHYLLIVSAIIALTSTFFAVVYERIPYLEVFLSVTCALMGFWLEAFSWLEIKKTVWRNLKRAGKLFIGLAALIIFFRDLNQRSDHVILSGILLVGIFYIVWRWIKPGKLYWLTLLATALMLWRLNKWEYSSIGDDFGFYYYALERFSPDGWRYMFNNLTGGTGVYHSHPVLSSFFQVISMTLFGQDGFGWRASSVIASALSLPFFYWFFKDFVSRRIAFTTVFLLGVSHYLINFSKIGYNNTQALFGMGLVLAAGGYAVKTRTRFAYSLIGFSAGFCFYLYPAALYAVPLPILLLLIFDPPKSKTDWIKWLVTAGIGLITILPLLFQPDYWAEKLPGTFFENIGQPLGQQVLLVVYNLIYSFYSYIYIVNESHYVAVSYVDPLTAILIPIGMAWVVQQFNHNKFARFVFLSFAVFLFEVGASSGRFYPSTTRMFMILPWFMFFGALGAEWIWIKRTKLASLLQIKVTPLPFIRENKKTPEFSLFKLNKNWAGKLFLFFVMILNIFMAYALFPSRSAGSASIEKLFLRQVERDQAFKYHDQITYLFVTDESWRIDGFQIYPKMFHLPASVIQLQRTVINGAGIDQRYKELAESDLTVIILQPSLDIEIQNNLANYFYSLNKDVCRVRETPDSDVRYLAFISPEYSELCPLGGQW
jgi:4-amino-4-deoxy-L-arabinose transferase-like glycosyltransferase